MNFSSDEIPPAFHCLPGWKSKGIQFYIPVPEQYIRETDLGAVPLRFSTDPITVFIPSVQR